jgi:hypothetical protein
MHTSPSTPNTLIAVWSPRRENIMGTTCGRNAAHTERSTIVDATALAK